MNLYMPSPTKAMGLLPVNVIYRVLLYLFMYQILFFPYQESTHVQVIAHL